MGGGRWDRTSGGKVGSSSQIGGAGSATPAGVDRLRRRMGVGVSRDTGRADQADGDDRGTDDDSDPAHEVHCFTPTVEEGPTEWPASGSLSAGPGQA